MATLQYYVAGGGGNVVPLGNATVVIGSGRTCDIGIHHPSVRRAHAEIAFDGTRHLVRALNGEVAVNGRVVQQALLANRDRIRLGVIGVQYFA